MKKHDSPAVLSLLALLLLAPVLSAQEPNFGRAVALSGEDLLIGQPVNWYGPGVVYTYQAGPNGTWSEPSVLTAPDSTRQDDFGRALALDGNVLVVGAPRKRDGSGVAYSFRRSGSGMDWEFEGVIEPPRDGDHGEYAVSLALAGDELLVGSPAVASTGVVYRYTRAGDAWTLQETISPPGGGQVSDFGRALSRDGDRLLVGAPTSDSLRGRVFVTQRSGNGDWSMPTAISMTDPAEGAAFGTSVLLHGGRAFAGAPGARQVVVMTSDGAGGWAQASSLSTSDDSNGSAFGFSLAAMDDGVLVGAPRANGRDGLAYWFESDGAGGWDDATRLNPDDSEGASWPLGFGYAVAATTERAVIGMPTRDFGEGRALTFARAGDGWAAGDLLEGRIYRIGAELTSGDRCAQGSMGEFPCTNIEMVGHMSVDDLGGERGVWVNDVWGWEDPDTGRRYALVARRDGASFVDVSDPTAPRLIGNLPRTQGSRPSVWRDIKVIGTHAYIVSDGAGAHGMQVFDLTRLRDVPDAPTDFEPDYTYDQIHSAHNVVADTASGFLYVVAASGGGMTCGGGLHMVDANDPERPVFAGCYHDPSSGGRGATHDAQCVTYHGPDEEYVGSELCFGSNESELNIADVTDKANPVTVARAAYPNVTYAHQGWLDDEQLYFYMNDEGDEAAGAVDRTRTLVWDLTDLDDPILVNEYFAPVPASDHNLYVVGDRMYQSNYGSGLRVLDISDRANPREIAHFDSAPYNNDGPGFSASESGAWSNYPFFEDGLVIFTSVREGLFLVRVRRPIS